MSTSVSPRVLAFRQRPKDFLFTYDRAGLPDYLTARERYIDQWARFHAAVRDSDIDAAFDEVYANLMRRLSARVPPEVAKEQFREEYREVARRYWTRVAAEAAYNLGIWIAERHGLVRAQGGAR